MIYEGTNGIQALDLIGRKLPHGAGRMLRTFFHPVSEFIEANSDHGQLGEMIKGFGKAFGALQLATAEIAAKGMADPEEAGAAATEYLRLFGLVALGFMWARSAVIAADKLAQRGSDAAFYKAKLTTARFYMERILPQAGGLLLAIKCRQGCHDGDGGRGVLTPPAERLRPCIMAGPWPAMMQQRCWINPDQAPPTRLSRSPVRSPSPLPSFLRRPHRCRRGSPGFPVHRDSPD